MRPVPWIIDYQTVVDQMRSQSLRCQYYNSGAFAFEPSAGARTLGWIGPPDDSIRPAVRALARSVPEPCEPALAGLALGAWQQHLPGRVWLMPMSHWSHELLHGNPEWLPGLIEDIDLDPGLLQNRNNAAAIEFAVGETAGFQMFLQGLLTMLRGSDFMMAFPSRPVLCMVHHHKQLWWTTSDDRIHQAIQAILP